MRYLGAFTDAAKGTLALLGIVFILLRLPQLQAGIMAVVLAVQLGVSSWQQQRGSEGASVDRPATLLGFLLIVTPVIHPEALLAPLLCYFLREALPRSKGALPGAPLLLITGAWLLGELIVSRAPVTAFRLWSGIVTEDARFSALLPWLQAGTPDWVRQFEWLLRLLSVCTLFSMLSRDPRRNSDVISGIAAGLLFALPVVTVQVITQLSGAPLREFWPNQTAYWDLLGRVPATFTDPNAFGIAVFLALPLLLARPAGRSRIRRCLPLLAAAIAAAALFSGSRAYLLGLGLWLAIWVGMKRPRAAVAGAVLGAAGLAILNYIPALQLELQSPGVPESIRRASASLVFANLSQSIFSRTLFWRIGSEVFLSSPWLGVGLGKFREFVIPLTFGTPGVPALWTDNANNMYLSIASELGLAGAGLTLLALCGLRFKSDAPAVGRAAAWAFVAVLFFGPHLEFNEVAALCAVLLATVAEFRVDLRQRLGFALAAILAPFIVIRAEAAQFGFYGWEHDAARYFRWTAARAQGWVHCDPGSSSTPLYLRASRSRTHSTTVAIEPIGGAPQTIVLHGDEMASVLIPCAGDPGGGPVGYRIVTPRPWTPVSESGSSDGRLLGVQVVTRDPGATLPF